MSKHTPGPWKVEPEDDRFVVGADNQSIYGALARRFDDEAMANAHLIAAAPELLEACKVLLAHAEWIGTPRGYRLKDFDDVFKPAYAAIAKAEGP